MIYHILNQNSGEFIGEATLKLASSKLVVDIIDGDLVSILMNGMHIDALESTIVVLVAEHTNLRPDEIYLTDEDESEILFAL